MFMKLYDKLSKCYSSIPLAIIASILMFWVAPFVILEILIKSITGGFRE